MTNKSYRLSSEMGWLIAYIGFPEPKVWYGNMLELNTKWDELSIALNGNVSFRIVTQDSNLPMRISSIAFKARDDYEFEKLFLGDQNDV